MYDFKRTRNHYIPNFSIYRILEDSLKKLKEECHWLRAVSWKICGQCKLCPGKVDKSGACFRHQKLECAHDDCAHYVPVPEDIKKPFCCTDTKELHCWLTPTWIQVSGVTVQQKLTCYHACMSCIIFSFSVQQYYREGNC